MYFSQLGAVAAFASLGHGLLLPPTVSSADTDIISTLPFEDAAMASTRMVQLPCPGCEVTVTDVSGRPLSSSVENALRLNFTVAHGVADTLLLNGLQIYPIDPRSQTFTEPLTAAQLVRTVDDTWQYAAEPKLGYSLSVKHPVHSEQDQLDLVAIHVQVVEVANKFLDRIPSVELKLLETHNRKLGLGDAEISASQSRFAVPTSSEDQECTAVVCKWRAIIADKLSKLKGCASEARPGAHATDLKDHKHGRPHGKHHPHPHGYGGHRPFRHHRHRHGFGRLLRNIVMHVLVPVLVGVAVGITASLVGMLVGNLVVFIYRTLFRRNHETQYIKVQQEEIIITGETNDESKAFITNQGPPPEYTPAEEKASE